MISLELEDLFRYLSNGSFITDIFMNESDFSTLYKYVSADYDKKIGYKKQYATQ